MRKILALIIAVILMLTPYVADGARIENLVPQDALFYGTIFKIDEI